MSKTIFFEKKKIFFRYQQKLFFEKKKNWGVSKNIFLGVKKKICFEKKNWGGGGYQKEKFF